MSRSEETQLVERAVQGDLEAFREIFELNRRNVYFLALEMTGSHPDAEDVMQEVFVKTHRSLSRFRGQSKLSSWIYRITVNTCIEKRRPKVMNDPSKVVPLDPEGWQEPPSTQAESDPEMPLRSQELASEIRTAMDRLTPLEKSVFVLRHFQHLKIREVAEAIDRSEGTVKNMLFRAVRKLQKSLAHCRPEIGLEGSR